MSPLICIYRIYRGRVTANDSSGRANQVATMLCTEAKKQFGDAVSIRWGNARDSGL